MEQILYDGPWKHELSIALRSADLGREVLLGYFGQSLQVSEKHGAGLVTQADRECEATIIRCLQEEFPQDGVLGEEGGMINADSHRRWILDPLDGTNNFVYGFPLFCISIALQVSDQLTVAVVDVPILKDRYWAIAHGGAFKNGSPIKVSQRQSLKSCMLATGFNPEQDFIAKQLQSFSRLTLKSRAVRRPGSAVFDLCMVAEGVFDGFWEEGLSPWDTAAGALLIKEAGGQVSDYTGNPYRPALPTVVASNGLIHQDLCHELQQIN